MRCSILFLTLLITSVLFLPSATFPSARKDFIEEPTEMTDELREIKQPPAVAQMTKFAFVGSKETLKKQVREFIVQTRTDEIFAASNLFDPSARVKSYQLFAKNYG